MSIYGDHPGKFEFKPAHFSFIGVWSIHYDVHKFRIVLDIFVVILDVFAEVSDFY